MGLRIGGVAGSLYVRDDPFRSCESAFSFFGSRTILRCLLLSVGNILSRNACCRTALRFTLGICIFKKGCVTV